MNSRSLGQLCAGQLTLLDSSLWPRGWAMCVIGHEAGAVDVWLRTHSQTPEKNLKHMLCAWCAVCGSLIYEGTITKALHNKWQHWEAWGNMRKETCCLFWCWQRLHFGFSTLAISCLLCVYTLSHLYSPSLWIASFSLGSLAVCLSCTSSYLLPWTPTCGIFVSDCLESSGLKCTPLSCTTSIQRNASLSPHAVELFSFVPLSRPSPRSSSIEVFLRPIFYLVSLLY